MAVPKGSYLVLHYCCYGQRLRSPYYGLHPHHWFSATCWPGGTEGLLGLSSSLNNIFIQQAVQWAPSVFQVLLWVQKTEVLKTYPNPCPHSLEETEK
jgi:hypothetical protein